jgi:hypothetical protein
VALAAAVVTMIPFVCAVNAAIWIDVQVGGCRQGICAGLAGGFVGAGVMALGIGLLPAGPRDPAAWLAMLGIGTVAARCWRWTTRSSSILPRCSTRSGRPASRSGWRWPLQPITARP